MEETKYHVQHVGARFFNDCPGLGIYLTAEPVKIGRVIGGLEFECMLFGKRTAAGRREIGIDINSEGLSIGLNIGPLACIGVGWWVQNILDNRRFAVDEAVKDQIQIRVVNELNGTPLGEAVIQEPITGGQVQESATKLLKCLF